MSSIDKYVASEARRVNPSVRVEKRGGMISGYIGGQQVFSIADRYGYLSESERNVISSSIKDYEKFEEERRELERRRIEYERQAARDAFKRAVSSAKSSLSAARASAMAVAKKTEQEINKTCALDSLSKYNVEAYKERAEALKAKCKSCVKSVEDEYSRKMGQIESVERAVPDSSNRETFARKQNEVNAISVNIKNASFPVGEADKLNAEIGQLKEALAEVEKIESQLKKIGGGERARELAATALKEICEYKISSLQDVDGLLRTVQGRLAEIRDISFYETTKQTSEQISALDGAIIACTQLRENVIKATYNPAEHRGEVVERADQVIKAYSRLHTAEYTTCSSEKIREASAYAQEALIGSAADEATLNRLDGLLEESRIYDRDDRLQADNYADFLKKRDELIEKGADEAVVSALVFDPFEYEKQRGKLNAMLLELDVAEGVNKTRLSFMLACRVMEEMGYRLLHHTMDDTVNAAALACEGIFVKPGCEGVVWQVVASENNLNRKIVGVERTNGMSTSVQRVKEVAAIAEAEGEVDEFFNRYANADGGEVKVVNDIAVYSDYGNAEQAIETNGCYKFESEEVEKTFDKMVQSDDAEEKAKWSSRLAKGKSEVAKAADAKTKYACRTIRGEMSGSA